MSFTAAHTYIGHQDIYGSTPPGDPRGYQLERIWFTCPEHGTVHVETGNYGHQGDML